MSGLDRAAQFKAMEVNPMDPINVLVAEHTLIRRFLYSLSFALAKLERGESLTREYVEQVVVFARNFVDKHHHFKEEYQMFRMVAQKHEGELDAQLEALRNQHEHGRKYITDISTALEGHLAGEDDKTTIIVESLAAYLSMLRQHINREDHIFYPMARKVLTEEEMGTMWKSFEDADAKAGEGFMEDCQDRILKMEALLTT
jgi:hemerythrin-like domain-containing protein